MPIFVDPPWGRQPGEGDVPFSYFQGFLRMPQPRKASKLAREEGKSPGTYQNYCGRFNWLERAMLWDQHQAALHAEEVKKATKAKARLHLTVLEDALKLGWHTIKEMLDKGEVLSIKDASHLIYEAIRLTREIKKDAQNIADLEMDQRQRPMDFSAFTPAELEQFLELLEKGNGSLSQFPDEPPAIKH